MNWKSVLSGIGYRVESRKEDSNIPWTKIILIVAVLATVIGALAATKTLVTVNKNIAAAEEEARPANVSVIKIVTPDCQDCFNVDLAVDAFKKQNVKVEDESDRCP